MKLTEKEAKKRLVAAHDMYDEALVLSYTRVEPLVWQVMLVNAEKKIRAYNELLVDNYVSSDLLGNLEIVW